MQHRASRTHRVATRAPDLFDQRPKQVDVGGTGFAPSIGMPPPPVFFNTGMGMGGGMGPVGGS